MPTTIDTNTLFVISHEIYRFASGVILDAANEDTSIESKARGLMPTKFAHEFFACLGRCRTKKSRIHELKLLAGICHAMAYEKTLALETQGKEGEGEVNNADWPTINERLSDAERPSDAVERHRHQEHVDVWPGAHRDELPGRVVPVLFD